MSELFLALHLSSLGFTAWYILRADHAGFNWIRGVSAQLDPVLIKKYHRGTWIGLCLMIVTGLFLFWPMKDYLLTRPQFYIKIAFVMTLICNGFVIGTLQEVAVTKTFTSLSFKEKIPLFISGAVSTLCWVGAAITAFFLIPD